MHNLYGLHGCMTHFYIFIYLLFLLLSITYLFYLLSSFYFTYLFILINLFIYLFSYLFIQLFNLINLMLLQGKLPMEKK